MRVAMVICTTAMLLLLQTDGLAAADPEPVIHDCLEGAGDDLKSADWEDLKFPQPAVPTG